MNITEFAQKHKTDKWGSHFYTQHYENHLARFRHDPITILEIGVGGYNNPSHGGNSLRVWSDWFTNKKSNIIGIDINEKNIAFDDPRVKIFKGSQIDEDFLAEIHNIYGDFDIIIDDGSHVPEHVIKTFEILYPKTKDGGIYIIEDTQTSYWDYGPGNSISHNEANPTMTFFKQVADWINYAEIPNKNPPNYFELHTTGVHFYHNIIFIDKNINIEKSNYIPSKLPPYLQAIEDDHLKYKNLIVRTDELGLLVHIGNVGDVSNTVFPSIISETKNEFIQGFLISTENPHLKDSIEYKARLHDGTWTEWFKCNNFVGTRGKNSNLTGFSVRLHQSLKPSYYLQSIGLFSQKDAAVIVEDGDECIALPNSCPLRGMQIILQRRPPE